MNLINWIRYKVHLFGYWRKHPVEPCGPWFAMKRAYYSGLSFKQLKTNKGRTICQVAYGTNNVAEFKIY